MIARLIGKVEEISDNSVLLDVNGVGYEVTCSTQCIQRLELGARATIIVFTDVKAESIRLYGFDDNLEKQVFILLTAVNGIGARTALEVVSHIDKVELLRVIGAGDLARLQSIKGIGKKTAERIVVELKDKVAEYACGRIEGRLQIERNCTPLQDAIAALQALGFSRKDAERAVEQVGARGPLSTSDSGEIVKEALKFV